MGEVVSLSVARSEREPHTSGAARCMNCSHEWEAVAPTGTGIADNEIECPECHLMRGLFKFPFYWAEREHWECNCGSQLFHLTPDGAYCPNCGEWHTDFE